MYESRRSSCCVCCLPSRGSSDFLIKNASDRNSDLDFDTQLCCLLRTTNSVGKVFGIHSCICEDIRWSLDCSNCETHLDGLTQRRGSAPSGRNCCGIACSRAILCSVSYAVCTSMFLSIVPYLGLFCS